MSASSPTSSISGFSKLPPIITSEAERAFFNEVDTYLNRELAKYGPEEDDLRYVVYKSVFNQVIENVTAYKPLLTEIKKEYEYTIEAIKDGQRQAVYLQEKLKALASEPSTIRNYKRRADELEERIDIVRNDNERLETELADLRRNRLENEKKEAQTEEVSDSVKKDRRQIPGMTLDEATDLKLMYRKLEKLTRQLKELNITYKTRYVNKTRKQDLKDWLDDKVNMRDNLLWQSQVYREKRMRLKIALEAAEAYNRMKPPHQTVGDAVILMFAQFMGARSKDQATTETGELINREVTPATNTTTFEEDDPNKEKEAEVMLEYIEKFNELFEDAKYADAAVHAANSPKGILRTRATLVKFREVKGHFPGKSPLLYFCEALMASVKEAGTRPNEELALDCVICALNENKLDLLYHWLAQDRLTLSLNMGHCISKHCSCNIPCMCSCQALAQSVFSRLYAYKESAVCLLKQGRVHASIQLCHNKGILSPAVLQVLLSSCPSSKLVNLLVTQAPLDQVIDPLLPLGVVLQCLVKKKETELVAQCLQDFKDGGILVGESRSTSLRDAILLDEDTPLKQWMKIAKHLQDYSYHDTAIHLIAIVTVVRAIKGALQTTSEMISHY